MDYEFELHLTTQRLEPFVLYSHNSTSVDNTRTATTATATTPHWDDDADAAAAVDYNGYRSLKISKAAIGKLDECFGFDPRTRGYLNLQEEVLSGRLQLESSPSENKSYSSLKPLRLESSLPAVSPETRNLASLKEGSHLCGRCIKYLPRELVYLRCLETLDLGRSQMSRSPKKIGQTQSLKSMSPRRNKLRQVPVDLGKLSIRYLALRQTNRDKLPVAVKDDRKADDDGYTKNCLFRGQRVLDFLRRMSRARLVIRRDIVEMAMPGLAAHLGREIWNLAWKEPDEKEPEAIA